MRATNTTHRHWRVRTTVPFDPRPRLFSGFNIERVRAPRPWRDRGLYVVRTPDGTPACAILRGFRDGSAPHVVSLLRHGLTLGAELMRFWPTTADIQHSASFRDGVGDFRVAVQFACQQARQRQLMAVDSPSSVSTP